jgi:hypothetical protein
MIKISAKDRLTARAANITDANLMLEAAMANTKTPYERICLLRAIKEAATLYMKDAIRDQIKEDEEEDEQDMMEAAEKMRGTPAGEELRDLDMEERGNILRQVVKVKRRLRRQGTCLHAGSIRQYNDDDDDVVGTVIG